MDNDFAKQFVTEWERAWNTHDINKIMSHYANDIILISPIAGQLLGHSKVRGIDAVRHYFMKGLHAYPDLNFKILDILHGEDSIVLYYINQNGVKVGEYMQFDRDGKVSRMTAHYST